MAGDRVSFGDSEVVNTRQLKMNGKKSRFQSEIDEKNAAKAQKEKFEEKADSLVKNKEANASKGLDLTTKYMKSFRDKTLDSQKGIMSKDFERQIQKEWQELIFELNNDPDERYEGMGSLAASALVFKSIFEMRDRINQLEYELAQVKKQLSSAAQSKIPNGT